MPVWIMLITPKSGIYEIYFCLLYKNCRLFANDSYCSSVIPHNAYVEDYHTCSDIFNEPVTAGTDNAGKSRSGIYDAYFCLP